MNPVNPIIPLILLIIILLAIKLSDFFFKTKLNDVKHLAIDGLRGYLAVFVFFHHGAIWYYYAKNEGWNNPPSNLFNHFGQTSVLLFFMITGFLFYSKLINSYKGSIDWLRLYVSRFLRITPLFLLAFLFMFIIVLIASGFKITEAPASLLKNIFIWLSFGIIDMPDLNNVPDTRLIIACVSWSLVYEWLFYFSLPLIALILFRIKTGWKVILLSVAGLTFVLLNSSLDILNLISFIGGIAGAFIYKTGKLNNFANSIFGSMVAAGCLVCAVVLFSTPYALVPLILLSVFFILIANGTSLFGLLHLNISRILGQISYTIYLMHGILLYVTFTFILKADHTPIEHWAIVSIISIFLIVICRIIYIYYEAPLFGLTSKYTEIIRKKLS